MTPDAASATAFTPAAAAAGPDPYAVDGAEVARQLGVDPAQGLSAAEAAERLRTGGPNRLAEAKKESGFRAFVRQYQDFMQIILLGAAVVNALVTDDVGTTVLLAGLTVLNAVIGLRQEAKAEASVEALAQMMKTIARVRRDRQAIEIDAGELVPGDIVLVEAGNLVPADGRILLAATLEIEEAALTGESLPVGKTVDPVPGEDVPLGDRTCMAYMNTSVTRGRGEFVVTDTGMGTEIGHIADMLSETETEKTPLQKQLDGLSKIIAIIAFIALAAVILLGLARDESFDDLFVTGVTLAVAAIPTGLPAVVTALLSLGTQEIARRHAIVKRLPAVETLGSTSAICSDKTGTLTLNKMTAREMAIPGQHRFTVSGEGYATEGEIKHVGGERFDLDAYLLPGILCADAVLEGDGLIGDPTEGALIVLGAKGGLDVDETRATYPRIAEVPFDSEYKFMATFHEMVGDDGAPVIRCFVKGAPDVLIGLGGSYRSPDGTIVPVTDDNRHLALEANDRMAAGGERVMVVARRDFDKATFDPGGDLRGLVKDLTLLAMVGIVDPPRAEARDAIAQCKSAGIRVRMITGDHATTAGAIGAELGIEGKAITGAEFAAMSDAELLRELPNIGVIARVAPEDKVRLVDMLKRQGNVVAMTGDGVNDAPALKRSDIGVAMGITGTEVTKEAADMILTDDNFATIVSAVEGGRGIYDNLMKYVRIQLIQLGAFILLFVLAGVFDVANGAPLNPLQILWINFAIDVVLAVGLGFDAAAPGLMRRAPRDAAAPIVDRPLAVRLGVGAVLMSALALAVVAWGEDRYDLAVATTMGLTTLSLLHVVAALEVREPLGTIFARYTIENRRFVQLIGASLVLTFLATELSFLQRILHTVSLTSTQWGICLLGPIVFVAVAELGKVVDRRAGAGRAPVPVDAAA
jgi:P-type Ca2+ transporter type 2C